MVRMSDLVRGITREAPRPTSPSAPAPSPSSATEPASGRAPAAPRQRPTYESVTDETATPTPVIPDAPPEDPYRLFGELEELLGVEVRGLIRGFGEFPWDRLQAIVERVAVSL